MEAPPKPDPKEQIPLWGRLNPLSQKTHPKAIGISGGNDTLSTHL